MDILESIFALIQKNFLDIITILWIIWFAGVALGFVVSTVSSCRNRRTLARLSQRYEDDRRRRDVAQRDGEFSEYSRPLHCSPDVVPPDALPGVGKGVGGSFTPDDLSGDGFLPKNI